MIAIRELRDRIDGMYAEPFSEEGQAEVNDPNNSHVVEAWEDGEVTSTKCGSLYQQRLLHRKTPPFLPEGQTLWDVPDDKKHQRMVVVDRDMLRILAEYREFVVNKEVIDAYGEPLPRRYVE